MSFIITGAASGLGEALTKEVLKQDKSVLGLDRFWPDDKHVKNLVKIDADLSNHEALSSVSKTLASQAPISGLVHNAAISATGPFENIPPESQKHLIDINLIAPLLLTKHLLEKGAFQSGSSIVFIASLSVQVGYPGATSYAATKAGLANFADSLRKAVRKQNIHVMTVYPGPMKTAQASRHAPKGAKEEARMETGQAAKEILKAMKNRKNTFTPGTANKVFAFGGKLFPSLMDKAMRKIIYDKLNKPVYEDTSINEKRHKNSDLTNL